MRRPAVFLDRDGTMIRDVDYLSRLEDVEWFPWTVDAIRLLNRAGFVVCVTTNQGGVGLGYFPESFVGEVHGVMSATLAAAGARVDGWFYCPHHPRARIDEYRVACECRKPGVAMVRQAERQFDLDLTRSFVVGDKASDIALGSAVGATSVLVRTGYGDVELARAGGAMPGAAYVAADLMAATSWVLRTVGHPQTSSKA